MMGIVAVAAAAAKAPAAASRPPVGELDRPPMGRGPPASSPPGPQGRRLYRRHERHHRIPLRGGSIDRLPELAADLVRRRVAMIVATGGPSPLAAKGSDPDNSDCLHHGRRSSHLGPRRQL